MNTIYIYIYIYIYMNLKISQTSDPYGLILNLSDKIN